MTTVNLKSFAAAAFSLQIGRAAHFDCPLGTEELGHMEMVAAIVHQLTRNLTDEEVRKHPLFASYFVDHTAGIYPTAASGFPWSAASIQSTGDVIADLTEDMAADAATA